jgi:hypothetical protein
MSIPSQDSVALLQLQRIDKKNKRKKIYKIVPHKRHTKHKLPSAIFVFDTEANIEDLEDGTQVQTLRFGYGLYTRYYADGRVTESDYLRFESAEEFYSIIDKYSRSSTKLYAFAHNIGYDWSLIPINPNMVAGGFTTDAIMDRKGNAVVTYERNKRKVVFIDTLNLFRSSLANLAHDFGLEKGNVDFRRTTTHSLEEYCKNDVYILNEIVKQWRTFLEKENYGSFKATIAAQSLEIFKQKYLDKVIYTDQGKAQKQLERECYYGGRCECNFIGNYNREITKIDINAAYPSVMTGNKFPYKYIKEIKNPTIDDLEAIGNDKCCFAHVALHTDKAFYPTKRGDKLIFPIGQFTTWLAEPELRLAARSGHIQRINRLYLYAARPLFSRFVADTYRKRREAQERGNTAKALMFKLLGNALYGKFGEWRKRWTPYAPSQFKQNGEEYEVNTKKGVLQKIINLNGIAYKYIENDQPSHSFPLIAAFTTSYLRVKLLDAMVVCGSNNWIYCDTDSLFVTRMGLDNLKERISQSKLGLWKIEERTSKLRIRGLKDYVFNGEEKIKGIPRDAKRINENTYECMQWQSMHKTICENLHGSVTITPLRKVLTREYYKGVVTKSGWVKPFKIEEFT